MRPFQTPAVSRLQIVPKSRTFGFIYPVHHHGRKVPAQDKLFVCRPDGCSQHRQNAKLTQAAHEEPKQGNDRHPSAKRHIPCRHYTDLHKYMQIILAVRIRHCPTCGRGIMFRHRLCCAQRVGEVCHPYRYRPATLLFPAPAQAVSARQFGKPKAVRFQLVCGDNPGFPSDRSSPLLYLPGLHGTSLHSSGSTCLVTSI